MEETQQSIPPQYLELIEAISLKQQPDYGFKLKTSEAGQKILAKSRAEQKEIVLAMMKWLSFDRDWHIHQSLSELLRRKLPFEHDEIITLLTWFAQKQNNCWYIYWCGTGVIKAIENYLKEALLTPQIQAKIALLVETLEQEFASVDSRRWIVKLKELGELRETSLPIISGEAWSDLAIQDLESLDEERQKIWCDLLSICANSGGSQPKSKWWQQVKPQQEKIGFDAFKSAILTWFPLVDKPRTQPINIAYLAQKPYSDNLIDDRNADILKGLVWLCAEREDKDIARSLMALAISAYRKLPEIGARCIRLGNACIWALGNMPGREGIGQLAVLKVRIKFGTAQNAIAGALTTAAERLELPTEELEEITVPTYGMETLGIRREVLGEFTVELTVTGTNSTQLRWLKADGKQQKSVPKAVKEHYPEELKSLKQDSKEIGKMLPAQRNRIESFYLQKKQWDLATWRERYLDHPLIGTLARRLIWQFSKGKKTASGIWFEGCIVTHDGHPLEWLNDSTKVELWHPIYEPAETVIAWRNWLIEHLVQQPFKQAYREIYLLTDAERNTGVYSNRFAAHIIKQHQFNSLCQARGWKNSLRLMVDDAYPPASRLLPVWGLRAEFWIEGIGDNYDIDANDTGTYLYLSTDQVRFYRINTPQHFAQAGVGDYYSEGEQAFEPLPLEEIPTLVFTEIMRDVDLFVGVASVANDPNWSDGGTEGRHFDYWTRYSFGELSTTAKTRKQVLDRLIPRLKISDRCELTDKFLVVRGDLRSYKIHLGSGNILMSPNDRYLCIVPSRGITTSKQAGQVFLPFEGDNMMAVILSKAFLLAADSQITDSTILSQIKV